MALYGLVGLPNGMACTGAVKFRGRRIDDGEMVEGEFAYRSRNQNAEYIIVVQEGVHYMHYPVDGKSVEQRMNLGCWVSV